MRLAQSRGAPEEILARVRGIEADLLAARDKVQAKRNELLLAFDHGMRMQERLEALRLAVGARRAAISARMRSGEEAPVWGSPLATPDRDNTRAEVTLLHGQVRAYVAGNALRLALIVGLTIAAVFALLRRRAQTPELAPSGASAQGSRGEVSTALAVAAGALVALAALGFVAPPGPLAFYQAIWLVVPWLGAIVALRLFHKDAARTIIALAFAASLNSFRSAAEVSLGAERILLLAQVVPLAAAMLWDDRRGRLARLLPIWHAATLRAWLFVIIASLAVAALASLAGFAGLARTMRVLTAVALGYAMVFATAAATVNRALAALLDTETARRLHSVREHRAEVLGVLRFIVGLLALVAWALAVLFIHEVLPDAGNALVAAAQASFSVGDITISVGGVAAAVAVVIATWAAVRFSRFLLTSEILPRFGLRPGIPIAIATITSYLVATTGFVLALAALGIDLTKVTLLAGALGVGIGFGLQTIVNNFVSGLILILERPVNVGDQIEIGELLGDVKRIGVRSCTVRTVQGAEVIVPNAELVSKQLVNWTLSDRSRRYEIDVGVAYGNDPDRVIRVLEEAAAEVPEIQRVPPPRVLFAGFGDSSLDFRLLAWAVSVDVGLQAQNNLRRAILARLTAEGIEIPFPQRDINIRTNGLGRLLSASAPSANLTR